MFVGITKTLLSSVEHKIGVMKEAELASVPATSVAYQGTEPWVLPLLWGPYLELRTKMPSDWKSQIKQCAVGVAYKNLEFRVIINFANPVESPPGYGGYGPAKVLGTLDASLVQEYLDNVIERNEIKAKWDKVAEDINRFLQRCKSLNEALKLWPQVAAYIPQDYLAKIDEKREKKQSKSNAAEALKSLDTEGLTAAAVTARILGAKV